MKNQIDHIERRDKELAYISDKRVLKQQFRTKMWLRLFNKTLPFNIFRENFILARLGVKRKGFSYIEVPFRCEYGFNIEIGDDFYANCNLNLLDVGKIKIGEHCQFGPNVTLCTAGHPLHPETRNSKYEYGIGITVGNSVWLGGNVFVVPGVTIGDNVVIGAGSVVVKDIPSNSVAVGNPCKVIKTITDADKEYFFKDRKIEPEILAVIFPENK